MQFKFTARVRLQLYAKGKEKKVHLAVQIAQVMKALTVLQAMLGNRLKSQAKKQKASQNHLINHLSSKTESQQILTVMQTQLMSNKQITQSKQLLLISKESMLSLISRNLLKVRKINNKVKRLFPLISRLLHNNSQQRRHSERLSLLEKRKSIISRKRVICNTGKLNDQDNLLKKQEDLHSETSGYTQVSQQQISEYKFEANQHILIRLVDSKQNSQNSLQEPLKKAEIKQVQDKLIVIGYENAENQNEVTIQKEEIKELWVKQTEETQKLQEVQNQQQQKIQLEVANQEQVQLLCQEVEIKIAQQEHNAYEYKQNQTETQLQIESQPQINQVQDNQNIQSQQQENTLSSNVQQSMEIISEVQQTKESTKAEQQNNEISAINQKDELNSSINQPDNPTSAPIQPNTPALSIPLDSK